MWRLLWDYKGEIYRSPRIYALSPSVPAAYAAEHCSENNHSHGYVNPYEWSCTAISYILEKQEYMGHTVLGKTVTHNFKTKKRRKAKLEELMIFKNTHEAIIDEETWNNA